jgi:hypothetical protein
VAFKIRVRKKLPARRLSVSLPGELHAKLELYQRLLGEGVGTNDVIAEALRLCFDADKEFRRIWEEEGERRPTGAAVVASNAPPTVADASAANSAAVVFSQNQKGSIR